MADIVVNQEACTQCGACIDLCTGRVFELNNGQVQATKPEVTLTLGYPRYQFRRVPLRRQPQLAWGGSNL